MRIWLVFAAVLLTATGRAANPETNVFESPTPPPPPQTQLDKLVFARLDQLKLQPVLCSDAVFVRRAYLDVLGTLPTANEAREFIEDTDTENKRAQLIDRLLERDEFADYWAMKWGDVLRIKAEFPVNLWPNAAQAYHRWVRASLAENKPYDKFARELLTSSGSNFRVGPVNFYRAIQNRTPDGVARAVALTFMGARAEFWPTNQLAGMSVFFSQIGYKPTGEWKEECVFWDPLGSSSAPDSIAPGRAAVTSIGQASNSPPALLVTKTNCAPPEAVLPDGTRRQLGGERDPREVFADWLIKPENPWFTRSIVNRVWAWLLGRGIIHEPDDIRDKNPPSNPELLAYLEREFVASHYNLRHLYRLILTSQTYQLSSMPRQPTPAAEANFAIYPLRRLDAEVLSDAINKVTGGSDLYTSPIPEPFTYIPKGMPAVAIADGSITSPFLALFGRSARATGLESERDNKPTSAQWLYLLNSSDVQRKLEQGPNVLAILRPGRKAERIIEDFYLTILSRFPTAAELQAIDDYSRTRAAALVQKKNATTNSVSTNSISTNSLAVRRAATNTLAGASGTNAAKPRIGPLGSLGTPTKATNRPVSPMNRDAWLDVAWSLLNSEEFLYRH